MGRVGEILLVLKQLRAQSKLVALQWKRAAVKTRHLTTMYSPPMSQP
jgi:hypothetical protein